MSAPEEISHTRCGTGGRQRFTCSSMLKQETKRLRMERLLLLCYIYSTETETMTLVWKNKSASLNEECTENKSAIPAPSVKHIQRKYISQSYKCKNYICNLYNIFYKNPWFKLLFLMYTEGKQLMDLISWFRKNESCASRNTTGCFISSDNNKIFSIWKPIQKKVEHENYYNKTFFLIAWRSGKCTRGFR